MFDLIHMLRRLMLAFLLFAVGGTACAEDLLEVDKAFRLSARAFDAQTIEVRYEIARGYYLYKDKFRFAVQPGDASLGLAQLPPGKIKQDEFFGAMETYRGALKFLLPVVAPGGLDAVELAVTSQGCADLGVCYPPDTRKVRVVLTAADPAPGGAPASFVGDETARIAEMLESSAVWLQLLKFFGFGLLLTFTPCVFPMLPIVSGIIVGQGHAISRVRALVLSSAYVLGMAVTYAAAGVAAGLSGTLITASLQNPFVLGAFALVFVVLALAMFGFYDFQMPTALQSQLALASGRLRAGTLAGVTGMGALSAVIVGPCVAAPLAAALLYIARTGDAWLGGAALFCMALGMGAPIIAVGVAARSLLPRPGPWMEAVKRFFGVVLLALAIWILSPVVPATAVMLAWAALLIFCAMFLRAIDPLPPNVGGWPRFWKGVGVVALLTGASLLIGTLAGSRDPLQPLSVLRGAAAGVPGGAPVRFDRVRSLAELDARLAMAGKPVMLDFYADWCVSCKEMERFTFSDNRVRARLADMVLLQADVTVGSADDMGMLQRFGLFGPPGIVFFDRDGREIRGIRVVGFLDAERFLGYLERVRQSSVVAAADSVVR